MGTDHIPEPFQFNPLKHHLGFLRDFATGWEQPGNAAAIVRTLKHIGTSVMDVYSGKLSVSDILEETGCRLKENSQFSYDSYMKWTGLNSSEFRSLHLSDSSEWILKFHDNRKRYIHIFPARSGPHTFRIKANTLKSAIHYNVFSGNDFITEDAINTARAQAGLSPVREVSEAEAIFRMIELLRS